MEPNSAALPQQIPANEMVNQVTVSRLYIPSLVVLFIALLTTVCVVGVYLYLQINPFFLNPPNTWWTVIYLKSMVGSGVFIILSGVSFVLCKKKKYLTSLIISFLVIIPFIVILSTTVQVYRNHLRILTFKADSESLVRGTDITDELRNDFAKTEGLLVPGSKTDMAVAPLFGRSEALDLSIPGFYYLKYSVATTTLHTKAFVTFSETSANPYSPTAYTQEVAISESVVNRGKGDRALHHFSYAGSPGVLQEVKVIGKEDLVSYILNWNHHGKNISIWMYYIPKDLFTKEQIIDLLGTLERSH